MRFILLCVAAAASCLIGSQAAWADIADLEKDIQASLEQSRQQVSLAARKLEHGLDASPEIARIKILSENIRITNLLLEERFRLREEKVKTLGSSALSRQQAMAEGYKAALTEYLSLIDSLPANGSIQQSAIRDLQSLLDKLLPKKKRPIIGSLPYKNLNLPAIEPTSAPAITPAYKGGNKIVSPDDTKAAPEAPISKEIAALAQSLNWNPVSIYEYVKNNVETEWYWGCMKGAEETLHQKSGNDCDQATLLTALLRASGYPTRYVRGVIAFFPDIERAKNLTGIDNPTKIAEFLQKAGIPYKLVIQGGTIANYQVEHIWVETQVPYSNYRGSIIDEHGKAWLGLDTSIKVRGYTYNNAPDIFQLSGLSNQLLSIRDEYLGFATAPTGSTPFELNQTPLEYLKSSINAALFVSQPTTSYSDYLRTKTIVPEVLNILPASTQFTLIKATNEYTSLPDDLIHKVKFTATNPQLTTNSELLSVILPLYQLSNQQITLSYEPETVQDQEIINSFGGLDNTPAYLVRLRPVLKVNGERIVVATDGLPMGADYTLTIDLISPSGTETISNTMIAGNLTVIGIIAQKAVITPSLLAAEGGGAEAKDAERILYETANHYIDRWNNAEDELASLLHLSSTRPLPTVVTLGGVIDVTYLLDMPHGFTWKGVYVDADLRRIETVTRTQGTDARQKLFMQLSSLQGSILENRIFEDDFKVESISTAKLIQIYQGTGSPLLTIDRTNIDSVMPTLFLDENIKEDIVNSVNQNFIVRIPNTEISYRHWTGTGYVKEKPETGESGWMLSGMIAGGMPVEIPADWINQFYANTLSAPFTGPTNPDPLMAAAIFKVSDTDMQPGGVVGKMLPKPLAVFVSDAKKIPVEGASVTFVLIAGGGDFGKLQCLDAYGDPIGQAGPTCVAPTTHTGFAKAKLTLGKITGDNPSYIKLNDTDTYYTQVGANLVTASVTGYSGIIPLGAPFEEFGAPDEPKNVAKILGDGASALVNAPAGTIKASVVDQYENPISNVKLQFTVRPAESGADPPVPLPTAAQYPPVLHPGDPAPSGLRNIRFYNREECAVPAPVVEDCTTYDPLQRTTQYFGAQAEAILGNTVGTKYTVEVTALLGLEPNPTATFTLYSAGYRNPANFYIPDSLEIIALRTVNDSGQPVDAAKVGTALKAPLSATLLLYEDDAVLGAAFTCTLGGQQTQCRYLTSTGTIKTRKISDGAVVYTRKSGNGSVGDVEMVGNGRYQAAFTTGLIPTVNRIDAYGMATVTAPEVFGTLSGNARYVRDNGQNTIPTRSVNIQTGQEALFNADSLALTPPTTTPVSWVSYVVYGVKAGLTIEPGVILLSDKGFTTTDITFTYTILPPEYNAIEADIDFFKKDQNNVETWDGWLPGDETQGTGATGLIRGTSFDIANLYTAEAVLNRGSDVEVRSSREKIPVAQISVLTDENPAKNAEEMKFGRGDNNRPEKIYHLELRSQVMMNSCASLTGKISIVNHNGQPISPPTDNGQTYAREYELRGASIINGCRLQVQDTLATGMLKDKYILSNRSRDELTSSNVDDKAVLYGGIGNTLVVEINGAKKFLPIEPVGVIVLAVDGLRQDVLYGADEQQVNPSGVTSPYSADQATLKGLCDVLGGTRSGTTCETAGWEARHIKLQNVTAIFPSITLASWASVFTGEQPGRTGILGNEFFARDLYTTAVTNNLAIPGMWRLPAGMVTLSDGAFSNSSVDFFVNNLLPVHDYASTVQEKMAKSSPNNALYPAPTIYEWITANVTGYRETQKCMNGGGECRSAVFFNHYARGADWWGTADLPWYYQLGISLGIADSIKEAFGTPERGAKTLDETPTKEAVDFLGKYYPVISYDEEGNPERYDKTRRFPAVFTVYYGGPDHYAHDAGMNSSTSNYTGYLNYFQEKTDAEIAKVITKLKAVDEFDNKLFVIVADHGHTAMPTNLKFKMQSKAYDASDTPIDIMMEFDAESSCKLNLDFGSTDKPDAMAMKAEQANNNLHIWELGDYLKTVGEFVEQATTQVVENRILAPKEIAKLFIDPGTGQPLRNGTGEKAENANIIAAMNGPMAHIYIKGADWSATPDINRVLEVAEIFRVTLQGARGGDSPLAIFPAGSAARFEYKIGRLSKAVDEILVRDGGIYKVYTVNNIIGSPQAVLADISSLPASYVYAISRIQNMNNIKRSGDIVFLMKDDVDIPQGEGIEDHRYTTGVACKSWHGSLNRSDSYVPFIFAYPGGNKTEIENILKKDAVCSSDFSDCIGNWKLADTVKEIIKVQYQ